MAAAESPNPDSPLQQVIAAYLAAEEAGQPPDRAQLLAAHPALADELRAFFADHDRMTQAAAPVRSALEATAPAPAEAFPQTFGDYELLEEIGRGGMGVVYKARQTSLNRVVALKRIRAGQLASPEEVARFRREAEAASGLDHPHIVPIYEIGEQQRQHYFTMKLFEGGNLANQAERFRADGKATATLMVKVAQAVHHAHQRGILHRDLKPSNILLDGDGQPHVGDFGLAQPLERESKLTQSGAIVGTPEYMAPEQARGDKGLTTAADVYGLGAILYFLLTDRPPFQADYNWEVLQLVVKQDPVAPRSINGDVPRDLETICLKCLDKNPSGRYGSAEKVAEDLNNWLNNVPINGRRVSRVERFRKWTRRRPAAAAALGVSLLAAVGMVCMGLWALAERWERDRAIAQKEVELDGKAKEIEQRNAALRQRDATLRQQDEDLRRRKWAAQLGDVKIARQSGKPWEALDLLKQLVPQYKADAQIGDAGRLFDGAFSALNTTGVRLVRTVELAHQLELNPRFNADSSVVIAIADHPLPGPEKDERLYGRRANLGLAVFAVRLPQGKVVHHKATHGKLGGGTRARFFGTDANIHIPTAKGWQVWNPATDHDVAEIPDEDWIETRFSYDEARFLDYQYHVLTTPDGRWQARGKRCWKTGDEKTGMPLPFYVVAVLSSDVLLLEDWSSRPGEKSRGLRTIAWSISTQKESPAFSGEFTAVLSPDLILLDQRSVWSVAKNEKRFELPKALEHLTHTPGWELAAFRHPQTKATEIWDFKLGKQVAVLPEIHLLDRPRGVPETIVSPALFSPDGRRFFFEPQQHPQQIHVWDRHSGVVSRLAEPHTKHRFSSLSPNGETLAAFSLTDPFSDMRRRWMTGEKVELWNVESKRLLHTVDVPVSDSTRNSVFPFNRTLLDPVTWSPDGRYFIACPIRTPIGGPEGVFHVFEFINPTPAYPVRVAIKNVPYTPVEEGVTSLRFSPEGSRLAVNGFVWQVRKERNQVTLLPPLPDSGADLVYFGEAGKTWQVYLPWQNPEEKKKQPIKIIEAGSPKSELILPWPDDPKAPDAPVWVYALGISPSGQRIAVMFGESTGGYGTARSLLQVWKRQGDSLVLDWQHSSFNKLRQEEDRNHIASAVCHELIANPLPIDQRITFAPDGKGFVLAGTRDAMCFDEFGKLTRNMRGFWGNSSPVFSADGEIFIKAPNLIINRKTYPLPGATVHRQSFGTAPVPLPMSEVSVALSANKKYGAIACDDDIVRVYDLAAARLVWYEPHPQGVRAMAFSPDGETLVTAGADNTLKVWNLGYIRSEMEALGLGWIGLPQPSVEKE